ncbi:hypothetical protein FWH58_02610 [Candidatus Saccharibacteria bacterium]|nr:hypothetical protein [Candidatus Saccharibacteria bacterium]
MNTWLPEPATCTDYFAPGPPLDERSLELLLSKKEARNPAIRTHILNALVFSKLLGNSSLHSATRKAANPEYVSPKSTTEGASYLLATGEICGATVVVAEPLRSKISTFWGISNSGNNPPEIRYFRVHQIPSELPARSERIIAEIFKHLTYQAVDDEAKAKDMCEYLGRAKREYRQQLRTILNATVDILT